MRESLVFRKRPGIPGAEQIDLALHRCAAKTNEVNDMKKVRQLLSLGVLAVALVLSRGLILPPVNLAGETAAVQVKAVDILTADDHGEKLRSPSSLFFDPQAREIYVVNAAQGRIVVYGPDFFPRISFGAGRGVDAPTGLYVDDEGRLYVCQGQSDDNPPRLTILNAALFKMQDILFQGFDKAESFIPRRIARGAQRRLYVAGESWRGVLVLDSDGGYLHQLVPRDTVWSETDQPFGGGVEARSFETAPARGRSPVLIVDVVSDPAGRLYLLSEETSKVYVYDADENFLFSFGEKGGSSGKSSRPRGIAVDTARNRVYLVDYMRHAVLVYDLDGTYRFEFGGQGWGPGWFNFPTALALDPGTGHLAVADLFNNRVQVLEVPAPTEISEPGLAEPGSGANFPAVPRPSGRR